jgi:hypothetical protein
LSKYAGIKAIHCTIKAISAQLANIVSPVSKLLLKNCPPSLPAITTAMAIKKTTICTMKARKNCMKLNILYFLRFITLLLAKKFFLEGFIDKKSDELHQ